VPLEAAWHETIWVPAFSAALILRCTVGTLTFISTASRLAVEYGRILRASMRVMGFLHFG
jgi:hypothetical protein